ncbi:hypothetical protein QVH35_07645 [Candidatus Nitrosotenuis chungbukensis]|uniref:hypothetical protein n=1 Tax=Candidatus Nitrosotenuis chungbukensis TaxID=1353246 RepID=UPI002672574B|nr:hypothetical protein [Candidatus Nitrosotenuis chungbukensis]WKT57289.1 hypothetical protein QVH35_07645 [Candidatus Nitrosotenuis chungbukensis]
MLSWASANESQIQAKLDSYTKDAYKIRASDILQRAKSIENLAEAWHHAQQIPSRIH